MNAQRRHDEPTVRIRPNPRGSRPRTKVRPAHRDATVGTVAGVDRGRYAVWLDTGVRLQAMKARELGRASIVVGDRVQVVGDVTGTVGTLGRVVRVLPRRTALRRSADDSDAVERVIVANADQLVIVVALADPPPRPRLIDRCLVAAYDADMRPLLCLTKTDLASADTLLDAYRPLGVSAVATASLPPATVGLEDLRAELAGRTSVLVGHSGVGKSTLVNALVPSAARATGAVNDTTGRGRHTSSSAVMFELPDGDGRLIDTPGVRSFGLAHVDPRNLLAAFADLEEAADECPRGCTHDERAPDCALDEWADGNSSRAARLASYRRLLASRTEATRTTGH